MRFLVPFFSSCRTRTSSIGTSHSSPSREEYPIFQNELFSASEPPVYTAPQFLCSEKSVGQVYLPGYTISSYFKRYFDQNNHPLLAEYIPDFLNSFIPICPCFKNTWIQRPRSGNHRSYSGRSAVSAQGRSPEPTRNSTCCLPKKCELSFLQSPWRQVEA